MPFFLKLALSVGRISSNNGLPSKNEFHFQDNSCGHSPYVTSPVVIHSSQRLLRKDYDRKGSVAEKTLFVGFKGLGAKMN
jgi:hypothetical protein